MTSLVFLMTFGLVVLIVTEPGVFVGEIKHNIKMNFQVNSYVLIWWVYNYFKNLGNIIYSIQS